MTDLLAARSQMAVSLGFHIIFAMVGIAMPVLMVVAEQRWQRSGDRIYLELAHRWAKGLIPPDLTIRAAAAPRITLVLVRWALALGALVLFPSLIYLFRVFKRQAEST
jgi:cytochrome bd-type quinol oxidase subunit 2